MTPLGKVLRARIEAEGPIPVADWMQACLGDPTHGYYMSKDPFGRRGDFITAPEISQMFGELLGLWSAVVWQQLGRPEGLHLIELGPGRGTLMRDALRAASGVPGFTEARRVHMVETSPALTALQQKALASVPGPTAWHSALADVPAGPSVILGNEFLDALPVRQLIRTDAGWRERCVDWAGAGFRFVAGDVDRSAEVPAPLAGSPTGTIVELAPAATTAAAEIAARCTAHGGAALLIDYGYQGPAAGDTLQAVKAHAFTDPLAEPGLADLTAHVDFAAAAAAAEAAGARVWGPVTQGMLLERLGLGARAATLLAGATREQAADIDAARDRLAGAAGMGRLFKAIAIAAPQLPAPPGFETVSWR